MDLFYNRQSVYYSLLKEKSNQLNFVCELLKEYRVFFITLTQNRSGWGPILDRRLWINKPKVLFQHRMSLGIPLLS